MEKTLYHGSVIPELHTVRANSKSHTQGIPVAYFTSERVYALICCRTREENFVTAGPDEDGRIHYYERFPNQLAVLYGQKQGWLYKVSASDLFVQTRVHVYESNVDVDVEAVEYIPNVYEDILAQERAGNLIVRRYDEIDPAEQKMMANHIKEELDRFPAMREFYVKHFSTLWD